MIDALLQGSPYARTQPEKERLLLPALEALTLHHQERSEAYRRILASIHPSRAPAARLADVPWIPVGLFKSHELRSIPEDQVFKVMTSSGTTGQAVSRVFLDAETAQLQSRALASIMTHLLGPARLPMLIVDSKSILRDRRQFSARAAGVLGMMTFGHAHAWLLDEHMQPQPEVLDRFLADHGGRPFLVFGFTFMVWEHLSRRFEGRDLSRGLLVHSGGWKKLQDQAVDNAAFKAALRERIGLARCHNFYGMVEQVGSVFLEGDDGLLYPPAFADVVVRDPVTWEEAPLGATGVVEVVSALPRSYPGHAILTEDLGRVISVDACPGRAGKGFEILGRVPRAELRGCSDTHAFGRAAGGAA